MKKLYKSEENKVFAGVIGGLGEYLDIDPVALRVLWVLVVIFTAVVPGIIVYLLATIIIPKQHKEKYHECCGKNEYCCNREKKHKHYKINHHNHNNHKDKK